MGRIIMNLDGFSEKTKIIINAGFNYFMPIHLLIILIQSEEEVKTIFDYFKIEKQKLLKECIKETENLEKKSNNTNVQGNLILLLESANKKAKILKKKNIELVIILMELCSDKSPLTKKILNKFKLRYENIEAYINKF